MAAVVEGAAADDLKSKVGKLSVKDEEEGLEEGEIVDDADSDVKAELSLHPLERTWKFWFDSGAAKLKSTDWGMSLTPIHSFSTIEDFWGLYNNIYGPGRLPVQTDLYCFQENIEPKWEDPLCANGGKWTVVLPKGKSDTVWLFTLLALIGEQFDYGDEICGAVVNVRKGQDKVSIWTKNASNETAQMAIGSQWKKMIDCHGAVGFIFHEDAKAERNPRNKYTV